MPSHLVRTSREAAQTQFACFLTAPGGGAAASALYTYQGSGITDVNVPLCDIFGSTVELVDPSIPGINPVTIYILGFLMLATQC